MTKANTSRWNNYMNASATHINQLYTRFSPAKVRAYDSIIRDCVLLNGYRVRVFGANSCTFSMAFIYKGLDGWHCRYYTHLNIYDFVVPIDVVRKVGVA